MQVGPNRAQAAISRPLVFLFLSTYYLVFSTHFAAAQLLQWYLRPYRRSLCTQVSKTVFVSPLARHSLSITPIYSTYFICWTTEIYRLAGTYITLLGYPGCASKHERKPDNIEIKIISLYLLIFYAQPPLLLPFHPQHSLILYCSDIASFKALQYVLIALLCCWNKTKTIGKFFYLLPVFSIIVKIISHTWMTNKFFWDPIIHFFQYFGGCEKHMVTK